MCRFESGHHVYPRMRGTLQPAGAEILHRRSREPSAVNAFMNITALARQGNPASLTLYYPALAGRHQGAAPFPS
jgi:hypothetical protein